jgi:hypothetical protein
MKAIEEIENTLQSLLDTEDKLYKKTKNIPENAEKFRAYLRNALKNINTNEVVSIHTYNDIGVEEDLSQDATATLKYLIECGIGFEPTLEYEIYHGTNSHSFRYSIENLLLDYQASYQSDEVSESKHNLLLKDPDLTTFLKNLLEFSGQYCPILYTQAELKFLEKIIHFHVIYQKFNSKVLESYLMGMLGLHNHFGGDLSCIILSDSSVSQTDGYIIFVNKQYPRAPEYLLTLKNKISEFEQGSSLSDLKNNQWLKVLVSLFDPLSSKIIFEYLFSFNELNEAVKNSQEHVKGEHSIWSIYRFPMSFYRYIQTAVEYNLPFSFILPKFLGHQTIPFNSADYSEDHIEALAHFALRPRGGLDHFKGNIAEIDSKTYFKVAEIIRTTLELIQTHICIELTEFFYRNTSKYLNIELSQITKGSAFKDQQAFLHTLNETLRIKWGALQSPVLLIHQDIAKLYIVPTKNHLFLLLFSLTPVTRDINFNSAVEQKSLRSKAHSQKFGFVPSLNENRLSNQTSYNSCKIL